jgi:CheY-like chemotaxis protein
MDKSTILVVDDDSVSLTLLSKLIERLNYRVVLAKSGEQALERLSQEQVELVVADYEMPGMDGLNLLEQVRASYPKVPYILVTAYSNTKVIRAAWEAGAFDFFQKPVFVERLSQTIRMALHFGNVSIARRKFTRFEGQEADPSVLSIGVVRELALAIEREDLVQVVDEYETNARIELEKMLRFALAKEFAQVKTYAHRLRGTSMNLGLVKFADLLSSVEANPETPIANAVELEQVLLKSVYWLQHYLDQIFHENAG